MKKLLQMRKYIIGFIVAIISIFAINSNVSADELPIYNLDYNLIKEMIDSDENFPSDYEYLLNYIDTIKDDYYVILYCGFNTDRAIYNLYLYVAEKTVEYNIPITLSSTSDTRINLSSKTVDSHNYILKNYTVGSSTINTLTDYIDEAISSNTFLNAQFGRALMFSFDENKSIVTTPNILPVLYSNIDLIYSVDTFNMNINNTLVTNGDKFLTYYDVMVNAVEPTIEMTKTFANDLDGNEIYIIRSDFSKVFDADYTYQIKTDYTDWQDITSDIFLAAESGYYFYDYTLRYNSKVYARVLNMQGEVVEENEIEVTELKDYMNITYAPANDLNGNYVITFTVDLRNCWNDSYTYQYSYDNETFYNMIVNEDNQVFYLNHGIQTPVHFRIIDSSNNVIYKKDYTELFPGLSFNPIVNEYSELINGERMIRIVFDISEFFKFYNIYNLRVVINGVTQELLPNYTYEIYSDDYDDFKEIDLKIYVDNYWVAGICYSPKYTQENFDDKYVEIVEKDLTSNENYFDMFKNSFSEFKNDILSVFSNINELWLGIPTVLRRFFIVIFSLVLFGFIIRFIL